MVDMSPSEKYLVQLMKGRGHLKTQEETDEFVNCMVREHGCWLEQQRAFDAGYNADRWISAKDRLPTEKDGRVEYEPMGTDDEGNREYWPYIRIIAHLSGTDLDPEEIREARFFLNISRNDGRLAHWQPLPPPPKQGA